MHNNNTPTAHTRPTRTTRARYSKTANAADTIQGFTHGVDICGLTMGQFSLLDLIDATLHITGPAHVTISTWSAGFYDIEAAERFRDSGRLLSIRFVMDNGRKRGQANAVDVASVFGAENIRATKSHAKFVTIRNDAWNVLITTSMNLNLNPRIEQFEMTDDPDRCRLFDAFADAVFATVDKTDRRDHGVPNVDIDGIDAVQPSLPIAVGHISHVGAPPQTGRR
ncbi:hypothetical protein CWT12_12320 [Actinomyces sp. 432]|uniref:hypothetical protein n=1 Tax=Actinomyces sp. 432 TaxID=2057798 RepID=UPI00137395A5|nr:hypothetical protein [Actinomyces sp. 432]QHO91937.1 hypothetical protein CWT12_12320 [Actinomyces sp. 432]